MQSPAVQFTPPNVPPWKAKHSETGEEQRQGNALDVGKAYTEM